MMLQFKLLLEVRIPSLLVSILARPGQGKKKLFLKTLRVSHTQFFRKHSRGEFDVILDSVKSV